jgi:hypothetical protein
MCVSCRKSVVGTLSLTADASLDVQDTVKKIHDELKNNVIWWVLEIFPSYYKPQNEHGQ